MIIIGKRKTLDMRGSGCSKFELQLPSLKQLKSIQNGVSL